MHLPYNDTSYVLCAYGPFTIVDIESLPFKIHDVQSYPNVILQEYFWIPFLLLKPFFYFLFLNPIFWI